MDGTQLFAAEQRDRERQAELLARKDDACWERKGVVERGGESQMPWIERVYAGLFAEQTKQEKAA